MFTSMTAIAGLLWTLTPTAEACESPSTNDDVVGHLRDAVGAYQSVDIEGFKTAATQAEAKASCLREAITPATAAELHRIRGLLAYVQRERDLAELRFAAARSIEPDYRFPTALVPEGNPVHDRYAAHTPDPMSKIKLEPPKEGSIRIDGSTNRMRFPTLPVTAQFLDGGGKVTQTLLLKGGEPLPEYAIGKERRRGPHAPLLILAGALGAVSGASAVVSNVNGTAHNDLNRDLDAKQLGARRTWANGMFITSAATGTLAAGFGVASFVKGTW